MISNIAIAADGCGQGNVLASRIAGDILSMQGFDVTIGETFGASQRGGSVMSHLRASTRGSRSPQIPKGHAQMVISLEPMEAVRVLRDYGNPAVKVICNMRPVHPLDVICGNRTYPDQDRIIHWLDDLSQNAWFTTATKEAVQLGNPIYSNVIMVGTLSVTSELPITVKVFIKDVEANCSDAHIRIVIMKIHCLSHFRPPNDILNRTFKTHLTD